MTVVDDATELYTIEMLDGSGHLTLTWDPAIPESVERALKDFRELQAQGYEFFRVISRQPSPVFAPEVGALEVVRVEAAEVEPRVIVADPPRVEPVEEPAGAGRRGRPRGARAPGERVVAGRAMSGG